MNAYLIAGHGSEPPPSDNKPPSTVYNKKNPTPSTFIVPDGCTIVVHKHPYEVAYSKVYEDVVKKLIALPKNTIINPIDHSSEIIKAIGSIAIYQAGQVCPNFGYTTQLCFLDNNTPHCNGFIGSGVNDILKMKDAYAGDNFVLQYQYKGIDLIKLLLSYNNLKSLDKKDIADLVSYFYRFSVYPTQAEVSQYIDHDLPFIRYNPDRIPTSDPGYQSAMITRLLDIMKDKPILKTTQEELCHKFQGVYYNFVCRFTEGTNNINRNNFKLEKPQTKRHTLRHSHLSESYMPPLIRAPAVNIHSPQTNAEINSKNADILKKLEKRDSAERKKKIENLLSSRIMEAELHRKPHIKRFYKNEMLKKKQNLEKTRKLKNVHKISYNQLIKNYENSEKIGKNKSYAEIIKYKYGKSSLEGWMKKNNNIINSQKYLNTFEIPSNNSNSTYTRVENNNGKIQWKRNGNNTQKNNK